MWNVALEIMRMIFKNFAVGQISLPEYRLTLTLFMAGVLAANDHDLAVTANDLAFVTHGFYRRSDFHNDFSLIKGC